MAANSSVVMPEWRAAMICARPLLPEAATPFRAKALHGALGRLLKDEAGRLSGL